MTKSSKQLLEESKKRRSYREFLSQPIDIDIMKDCILTAGTAPSGADKQPWHFVVVTDNKTKIELRKKCEEVEKTFYEEKISKEWQKDLDKLNVDYQKPFLTQAPCLIVVFKEMYILNDKGEKEVNYYQTESVGIAIGMLINALRNAGYSSLTYTPSPMMFLRDFFNRPKGETPVMILAVGQADLNYQLPELKKKTLDEIATFI